MMKRIVWNGVLIQSEVDRLLAEYKKKEAMKLVCKMFTTRTSFNKKWSIVDVMAEKRKF